MRFFTKFILSETARFFAALRMTNGEGFRMTNFHFKAIATQPLDRGIQDVFNLHAKYTKF